MWIYYLCGGCGVTVGRIETRLPVDDGIAIEMDDGAVAADIIVGHCHDCRPALAALYRREEAEVSRPAAPFA